MIMYSIGCGNAFQSRTRSRSKGLTWGGGDTAFSPSRFTKLPFTEGNRASDHCAWCEPSTRGSREKPSRCQDGSEQERMQKASQKTLWGAAGERDRGAKGSAPPKFGLRVDKQAPWSPRLAPGGAVPIPQVTSQTRDSPWKRRLPPSREKGAAGAAGVGAWGPGAGGLRTHVCVETVGHELELAVRRDEGDGAVVLKREPHALVELHVLQLHGLAFATCRERERGVTGRRQVPQALSATVPCCLGPTPADQSCFQICGASWAHEHQGGLPFFTPRKPHHPSNGLRGRAGGPVHSGPQPGVLPGTCLLDREQTPLDVLRDDSGSPEGPGPVVLSPHLSFSAQRG